MVKIAGVVDYYPSEDVQKIITDLKKDYPEAGYRFAHISLSDYNLGDHDLAFCIEPARVFSWIREQLKTKDRDYCDPTSTEDWQRCQFEDVMQEAQAIMTAVIKIQEIPSNKRFR